MDNNQNENQGFQNGNAGNDSQGWTNTNNGSYQNGDYQNGGYQNGSYQNGGYQNNSYQNNGYNGHCVSDIRYLWYRILLLLWHCWSYLQYCCISASW